MYTNFQKSWFTAVVGGIFFSVFTSGSWGQTIVSEQSVQQVPTTSATLPSQPANTTAAQAELVTFQQEQKALMQESNALLAQGATAQQFQAWQQQNAARLAAQTQRAKDLAAASAIVGATQPIPMITAVTVPAGATQEMADFLTTKADLQNRFAQLHNQDVAAGTAGTAAAIQNETLAFQQQNSAEIAALTQKAQALSAQSAQTPLPLPPPLNVPSNATPQFRAFLTLRDQLMREELALRNQYIAAAPATREAAVGQWKQQNASRFAQLQQLTQNLSNPTQAQ